MHRGKRILFVVAVVAGSVGGVAQAAFETLVEVVQPMDTSEGIQVATAIYSEYMTTMPLGLRVALFARDSRIMDQHGAPVSRNLAYLTGVQVRTEPRLLGDTLRVYLDLRNFKVDEAAVCCSDSSVIRAIYDCLLINAYNSRQEYVWEVGESRSAEVIDVRVLGDRFGGLQGVKTCREIANDPWMRRWLR